MLSNRKIARHFLFYKFTNLDPTNGHIRFGIYNYGNGIVDYIGKAYFDGTQLKQNLIGASLIWSVTDGVATIRLAANNDFGQTITVNVSDI